MNSSLGHKLELVAPEHGDGAHRVGNVAAGAVPLCTAVQDDFVIYGLLDAADARIGLPAHFRSLPILFYPGYEEAGRPLIYRADPVGDVLIVSQAEDRLDRAALIRSWPKPSGVFGACLTALSEELAGILQRVERGWYNQYRKLSAAERRYVEGECFGSGPFHQVGGPPLWLQKPIDASCPQCAQQLQYVLSLDSDSKAGWMFGDMGRLYVLVCRQCSVVLCDVQCT